MCEPDDPADMIDGVARTLETSAETLMDAANGVHARGDDLRLIAVRLRGIAGEVRSASRTMPVTPPRPYRMGRNTRTRR